MATNDPYQLGQSLIVAPEAGFPAVAAAVEAAALVPEAAATVSRAMRNQYVLGYRPTGAASVKWRKIKVRLTSTDERSLRAYYRKGYLSIR